jgi:hypothetical protein
MTPNQKIILYINKFIIIKCKINLMTMVWNNLKIEKIWCFKQQGENSYIKFSKHM